MGTARYCGLVEFEPNECANKHAAKIYFDLPLQYPHFLRVPLCALQCTDVQYIRRGTRIHFSLKIDRKRKRIVGVKRISAPNNQLLTFLLGERGEFYRWRNINCKLKLPPIRCCDTDLLFGFVRSLDIRGKFGVIEVVSKSASYEPVLFWFDNVLFAANECANKYLKQSSVVQFNVTMNERYKHRKIKQDEEGNRWNEDPQTWLSLKAINIASLGHETYLRQPPLFKMKHVELLNQSEEIL